MLNSETKQKINNLRDLLVGKIPNPQGQVQQITLALMYKFMSDIDDSTNELFENTTFFPGEFAEYKWTYIMDSKLSAQERLNLYAEGLEKMNHNPAVPQLFRHIFKQAFLPFRDPQTLDRFLKQIDEFEYEHSEDLGDAFEYLLSSLSAAGDAGQFRTPRHIIDFIVEVVQPDLSDKILDPACGTAGFLVSAYKYLVAHHKDLDMNKISNQIVGYDISPEMVQLALVNLYLHQFPDPKIEEYDTLTSEAKRSEKFDCILANPPFMTPKGGITPHNKFSITSNRSEVLFVDYIMEHLRSTGKAGIIVPEGVIFQSANAYKALRKALIDTGGLWAVVSLPAGVFNPYAGVKTSVLLLDKTIKTDNIVFAKITADGYDLGAQRREISNNDLPTVLDDLLEIKEKLKAGQELGESTNPLIWAVEKSVIADSGDHNLSAERYKASTSVHQGNWEMVELGELIELNFGTRITKKDNLGTLYPVYGGGGVSFYTDQMNRIDEYVISRFAMSQECVRYVSGEFFMLDSGFTFNIRNGIEIRKDYVGKILLNIQDKVYSCARGHAQKNIDINQFLNIEIPLPPLEIQEQIVAELTSYQAIIDGAKTIITNRKPKIDIQEDWEMVELGEVCDIISGQSPSSDFYNDQGEGLPFYQGKTEFTEKYLGAPVKWTTQTTKEAFSEDILMSVRAPVGPVNLATEKICIGRGLAAIRTKGEFLQSFIFLYLQSIQDQIIGGGGSVFDSINRNQIMALKIPKIDKTTQQQIVAQIEHEQKLVDSAKELVEIYESKIQERVSKVWEG